jgi:hypothetical protein
MPKSKDETRRKYPTEESARSAIINGLSEKFEFFEEVQAIGPEGDHFRIDAVSKCREKGWFFGWEFKRSHLYKSEFSKAISQAIDYRYSRINDSRISHLVGMRLPAIALFPDWLGEHDEDDVNYGREAEGMRLVGAKFRVGTMRENNDGRLGFIMGQSGIWHSSNGWVSNAENILFGKRDVGSQRKRDR